MCLLYRLNGGIVVSRKRYPQGYFDSVQFDLKGDGAIIDRMQPKTPENKKKAGVCYAVTDDGLELPVIDVTHPAFEIKLNESEQQALLEQFLQEIKGPEKTPTFLRQILFGMMRKRPSSCVV